MPRPSPNWTTSSRSAHRLPPRPDGSGITW